MLYARKYKVFSKNGIVSFFSTIPNYAHLLVTLFRAYFMYEVSFRITLESDR